MNIPRFSEEQKQSCEKEIFVEEITAILNSFENKKSPGNDGIPIEFYKSCGELISDPFMECVRVFLPRWNVWLSKKSNHNCYRKAT